MRNVWIVFRREFLERVRSKAFGIGTVLFPVFLIALMILPGLLRPGGGERAIAIVDEAPAEVGDQVIASLQAPGRGADEVTYRVTRIRRPLAAVQDSLATEVQEKRLAGYLALPADIVESSRATYRARQISSVGVLNDLTRATSDAVRAVRLRRAGIDPAQAAALARPVTLDAARLTESGKEGGSPLATMMFAYIVGILFIQLFVLHGQGVMRGVLEEKTGKIVEVIVTSVRPTYLMAGKLLGIGAAALLQVGIWVLFAAVVASQAELLGRLSPVSPEAMKAVQLPAATWLVLILFFALGFLFFAAIYAAVGAMVSTEQEAQQMAMPVMVLMFIPIIFIVPVLSDPLGATARTLSMIPFTAPVVMPMRMGATEIPGLEVVLSILSLVAGIAIITWIAGKIYRVGILSTGKKPSLAEVVRWMRAA